MLWCCEDRSHLAVTPDPDGRSFDNESSSRRRQKLGGASQGSDICTMRGLG